MKRLVTILLITGFNLVTSAQSCIPDYISFYLQSQVDSFQINYPGCTEIEGDVYISGNDITNLIGLAVLTSIGGDLRIENASSLTKLIGLNNLSYIGEDLIIEENEALYNFEGLSSLVQIEESFILKENTSLISLSGLDNLTTIGEDFNIGCSNYSWTGNLLLNNLSGLNSLTTIGNSLRVCNNHGLADLSGIENLTSVENIYISWNDSLINLTGLQGVTNVNGYISFNWNNLLNSLHGLNNLTTVGDLTLHRLPNLDYISGLDQLSTVNNNLTISVNSSLDSIGSLDSLTYIGGKLVIDHNTDLINLSGMENLTVINGGLEIRENYNLLNINALSSITSIGGDLIIHYNLDLISLAGLSGVTSIGGNLKITVNHITSLAGIENINPSSIEDMHISCHWLTDCAFPNICEYLSNPNGVVDIYGNIYPCENPIQIANECGFTLDCLPFGNYHFHNQSEIDSFQTDYPDCTDLEGSLYICSGGITDLDGLSVVTSIDGELEIFQAYNLNSLSGIDNIDALSILDLSIWYNPELSECEVQSICDYLANPNSEVYIADNASGCNHPNQVLNACETVSIQEHDLKSYFKISPNPASHYLLIDNQSGLQIDKIIIYNSIGQTIYMQGYMGSEIQISELDQGIYILEIITDDLRSRFKFTIRK